DTASELAPAGADRAGDAEDLAAAQLEVETPESRALDQALHAERDVALVRDGRREARLERLGSASEHELDETVGRQARAYVRPHHDPVPQDGDRLRDL